MYYSRGICTELQDATHERAAAGRQKCARRRTAGEGRGRPDDSAVGARGPQPSLERKPAPAQRIYSPVGRPGEAPLPCVLSSATHLRANNPCRARRRHAHSSYFSNLKNNHDGSRATLRWLRGATKRAVQAPFCSDHDYRHSGMAQQGERGQRTVGEGGGSI